MPKKILVADDSATIQRAVKIALSEEDLILVPVRKASEVLATARAESPDAILLDNQFHQDDAPDGYGLCAALKQDPALSHIPVAFFASRSYDKSQGEEAGAVLFFEKPFESKTLADGVTQLLEFASVSSSMLPAVGEPEAPGMPLFTDMVEEDEGETVISTSHPSSASLPEAPAPAPPAPITSLAQPVPRETTAMPTFNPVAFSNLLGDESAAPAAATPVQDLVPDEVAPPLFSPPPEAPAPAEQLSEVPEPPAFSPPTPPPFSAEAPDAPPSFGGPQSAGVVTPPPLDAPPMPPAPPSPPPLSAPPPAPAMPEPPSFQAPETSPFGAPAPSAPSFEEPAKPRQKPLIIPAPSDEPREFPVKDLLAPTAVVEADDDLEMEAPVFLDQQPSQSFADSDGEDQTVVEYVPAAAFPDKPAVAPQSNIAPQTDTAPQVSNLPALAASVGLKVPSFALNPKEDYLARALNGERRTSLRQSSAGTSVQVQAVQEMAGETIERIAWEVVPELAELIIREMIGRQNP